MTIQTRFALSSVALAALLGLPLGLMLLLSPALAAEPAVGAVLDPSVWRWGLVAAAVATGLSSLAAGYAVAAVATAAAGTLAEKPELFGRLLILVGLAEGIAIYGLIVSILILNKLV